MKQIYLDHSATTPLDKQVLAAMSPYFSRNFGNPSSIHSFGQIALAGVDQARSNIAQFLNCLPEEVIFTSGATEADNLAIFGVIRSLKKQGIKKMQIITSQVEHPAVLEPVKALAKEGVEVAFLPVKANGIIDLDKFQNSIKDNTVLVSVMYVNSEVGCAQPIREIGKIIEKINRDRLKKWQAARVEKRGVKPLTIYFHTDAVQAANFFNCDTKYLHVDLLSLSGHKIYGPKGIGVLFVKNGVPLEGIQLGGHHERNKRSGTLNVPAIVGLGKAIELLDKKSVANNNKKIANLRDRLIQKIKKQVPNIIVNTDVSQATPAHAHFSFPGAEGEAILIALDLAGIAVSTGSACASGDLKPSAVLLAMGVDEVTAHSSIRFTLGKYTAEEEIDRISKILPPIIKHLRQMSPEL